MKTEQGPSRSLLNSSQRNVLPRLLNCNQIARRGLSSVWRDPLFARDRPRYTHARGNRTQQCETKNAFVYKTAATWQKQSKYNDYPVAGNLNLKLLTSFFFTYYCRALFTAFCRTDDHDMLRFKTWGLNLHSKKNPFPPKAMQVVT